jgi:putative ABC transport system permease protein
MLKNYVIVALRNIWRNRSFSFINIFSLAASLSVCLVVISILVQNFSYDNFHHNKDRIVRLVESQQIFDMRIPFASVPLPVGDYLKEHSDAIEEMTTMVPFNGAVRAEENVFNSSGLYADDSFFKLFSFEKETIAGSLRQPYTVIMSHSAAEKYFGTESPVGKVISITDLGEFTVTGVVKDPPVNSHIKFELLLSLSTLPILKKELINNWQEFGENQSIYHYFLLKEGKSEADLMPIIAAMMKDKYAVNEEKVEYRFQKFNSIAPSTEWMNNEVSNVPHGASAYFLLGIALLIMVSAGFNYTNLSIARSLTRAREVGLRKVSGASRQQVYGQFIAEATIISLFALVVALAFVPLLQDAFTSLLGGGQGISFATDYRVYIFFFLFTLLVGWAVGALPASLLSKFKPAEVLKDSSGLRVMKGIGLRKTLIIFQFAMSVVFLISANVITRQFQFALDGPMGFNHNDVISVMTQGDDYRKIQAMAAQQKEAIEISASSFLPGTNRGASEPMENPDSKQKSDVFFLSGDQSFISSIDLKLVAGKNFPLNMNDSTERFILVNETLVKQLGYQTPSDALSKIIKTEKGISLEIIGVLKDFHYRPLDADVPIGPAAVRFRPHEFGMVNIKFQTADKDQLVASLEKAWKELNNGHPFEYAFFDEQIQRSLNRYRIMNGLTKFVSLLTVTIACLGLLGMALYSSHTRLKEIAVRKVIGATEWQVVMHLSKGFVINLMVACGLALPIGYFVNKMWLDRLPYHIEITVGLLLSGVVLIFLVGMLTIISQTWRAAAMSPTKFLKRE